MIENVNPQIGVLSESTSAYIIGIHQSYIESAAVLSLYLLSKQKSGKGITFSQAFRLFYRDFFRLYNVTADLEILSKGNEDRAKIEQWFKQSKGILDLLKTDRDAVYEYAETGLELGRQWISQLYIKQVITTQK